MRGEEAGTFGTLFAGLPVCFDYLLLPVALLVRGAGFFIERYQLVLCLRRLLDRLRVLLDKLFVCRDGLLVVAGLLVKLGRGPGSFAFQSRVCFVGRYTGEFPGGLERLLVFQVQGGEFTCYVSLKLVVGVALAPLFQYANSIRPLLESDVGRRGIVTRGAVD